MKDFNQSTYLSLKRETYNLERVRQNLIRAATVPFLGFSVSLFDVEICHIPFRILRRNVNTSNFTPLIFNISSVGYTR